MFLKLASGRDVILQPVLYQTNETSVVAPWRGVDDLHMRTAPEIGVTC